MERGKRREERGKRREEREEGKRERGKGRRGGWGEKRREGVAEGL